MGGLKRVLAMTLAESHHQVKEVKTKGEKKYPFVEVVQLWVADGTQP